ncbi:hypothetical protein ABZ826_23645 [Streptomyces sp. NPDC047515]|uniref:hypothetical protein n=1 Tax=Streptomyces sp. NPDC047515 TaxID=3155380 RepID=UPI0033D68E20
MTAVPQQSSQTERRLPKPPYRGLFIEPDLPAETTTHDGFLEMEDPEPIITP